MRRSRTPRKGRRVPVLAGAGPALSAPGHPQGTPSPPPPPSDRGAASAQPLNRLPGPSKWQVPKHGFSTCGGSGDAGSAGMEIAPRRLDAALFAYPFFQPGSATRRGPGSGHSTVGVRGGGRGSWRGPRSPEHGGRLNEGRCQSRCQSRCPAGGLEVSCQEPGTRALSVDTRLLGCTRSGCRRPAPHAQVPEALSARGLAHATALWQRLCTCLTGVGPGAGASSLKRASKKAQPPESHPSEGDGACGVPGSPPPALPQGAAGGPSEALYGQNHPAELAPRPLRLYFGPGGAAGSQADLAQGAGGPDPVTLTAAAPRTEARPRLACCGPPRTSLLSVRLQGLGAPPRCCHGQTLFHGWPRPGQEQLPQQDLAQPTGSHCVWAPGDSRPGSACGHPGGAALPGRHPDPGAPSRARAAAASNHLMDLHAEVAARCGGKGPWSPAQVMGRVWPSWVRTLYARKPQTLMAEALPPNPPGLRPPPSGGSLDATRGDRGGPGGSRPPEPAPCSRLDARAALRMAVFRLNTEWDPSVLLLPSGCWFTHRLGRDAEPEAPNRKLRSWGSSEGLRYAGGLVTEGQRESRAADPAPTLPCCPPAGLPKVLEEAGALLQRVRVSPRAPVDGGGARRKRTGPPRAAGPKPGSRGGCDPASAPGPRLCSPVLTPCPSSRSPPTPRSGSQRVRVTISGYPEPPQGPDLQGLGRGLCGPGAGGTLGLSTKLLRLGRGTAPGSGCRSPCGCRCPAPSHGRSFRQLDVWPPGGSSGSLRPPGPGRASWLPAPVLHAWLLMRVAAPPRQVRSRRQALSVLRPRAVHVPSTHGSPTAWRQPPSPDAPFFSAEVPCVWSPSPKGFPGPRPHPPSVGRAPTFLGSNGPKGAVSASTMPGSVPSTRRAPGEAVPSWGEARASLPPCPPPRGESCT
uniref:collagen alpha-1(I) chain-like n=1 Tax=Nyctereutes procyonoides TaxID=34880 RepID=UPI0024449ED5|nr:collagen alpha-1(I) chain-like [Nyctereutes procyonoides]